MFLSALRQDRSCSCKFSEWLTKGPEKWLKLIEAACLEVELPPSFIMGKLSKAIGLDSNRMADWLSDRTAEGGRVKASWAEYRQAFISFFPGLPPTVTRDAWTALSQNNCGSYHKYVEKFQQQAEELQAGEAERIHNFKRGLHTPSVRCHVEIDPVTTLEWASFAKLRDAATGYANAKLTSGIAETAGRSRDKEGKGKGRRALDSRTPSKRKRSIPE